MTALRRTGPRHWILALFFIAIAAYALFQARFVLFGPKIEIISHTDGAVTTEPLVVVEGTAKNISYISFNGRQIFIEEDGSWSENLVLSKGINVVTVGARNRFGHETEERLRIFLE